MKVQPILSFALFGALMAMAISFNLTYFGNVNFNNGITNVCWSSFLESLKFYAIAGAAIGAVWQAINNACSFNFGKDTRFSSAFRSAGLSIVLTFAWGIVVSLALVFAVEVGHSHLLEYQRSAILFGAVVIPLFFILKRIFSDEPKPVYHGAGSYGGYSGSGSSAPDISSHLDSLQESASQSSRQRDFWGNEYINTSDGGRVTRNDTMFGTERWVDQSGTSYTKQEGLFGGTSYCGSDGSKYEETTGIFGGSYLKDYSTGKTYEKTTDFWGNEKLEER